MPAIRSEFSKRSRYYIPKHRYLSLVHHCLMYPEWKKEYDALLGIQTPGRENGGSGSGAGDPTARNGEKRAELSGKTEQIEKAARLADRELSGWILFAVTHEGMSYEKMAVRGMPCGKNMFYDRRRRFFWHLDKMMK